MEIRHMSKVLVKTNDLPHEDWIRYRKMGIGGSDVGAICGLNPWASAIDVYMDKLGLKDEKPDNEAMRQGRDLEEYVAWRFEEATGKKVRRRNAILQHDEYDFMLANIDREIIGENAGLECKTASVYATDKWADDKIPPHYELQCYHYMAVTGAERWYLCCLILNKSLEIRTIERDAEVINQLIDIEKAFWTNNILGKVMPPPDGSKAAGEILRSIYQDSNPDEVIELTGFDQKLKRYDEIVDLENIIGSEKEQIKQEIMAIMGEAETAYCKDRRITWKKQAGRKSIDTKLLKAEKPDIYLDYLQVSDPIRVFRI
jgi:putative phage-type endonuclease